jgi:hypothetical protein
MDDAFLLAELQRHLAAIPAFQYGRRLSHAESAWLGKATSLIERWDKYKAITFRINANNLDTTAFHTNHQSIRNTMNEAIGDLQYKVAERPGGTVFRANTAMDFHFELKGILALATTELLVVDPYLNEEVFLFVADTPATVAIRMMMKSDLPNRPNKLIPGLKFAQ